jgi:transketolase N-terminal domain/subunit
MAEKGKRSYLVFGRGEVEEGPTWKTPLPLNGTGWG